MLIQSKTNFSIIYSIQSIDMLRFSRVLLGICLIKTVSMVSGLLSSSTKGESMSHLYIPSERDGRYGSPLNVAQYLVDLHDAKATFNFCGGMMFQLVLTDKLRDYLENVATSEKQPIIFDANQGRMSKIPNYAKDSFADNVSLFHGREIRRVPNASGGFGFVLQLSMANANDPQGWTPKEIEGYDGWRHDVGRDWRTGDRLEKEGFKTFRSEFGPDAFTLNHRFYLHKDWGNQMWLSAEDGCEGTPEATSAS